MNPKGTYTLRDLCPRCRDTAALLTELRRIKCGPQLETRCALCQALGEWPVYQIRTAPSAGTAPRES